MPTHDAGVGIDGPGGAVDGARGEVNDTRMFWGALHPGTSECGDAIHQRGPHLLRVCHLAIPQYEKGEWQCTCMPGYLSHLHMHRWKRSMGSNLIRVLLEGG